MEDFAVPGTWESLILRLLQCMYACFSIIVMDFSANYYKHTALCCLMSSMTEQVIWGFSLTLLDTCLLFRKSGLYTTFPVVVITLGDWAGATLSLGSVSASAGIMEKLLRDAESCKYENECYKYQLSIGFAFFTWIALALSSLCMLWLLAQTL